MVIPNWVENKGFGGVLRVQSEMSNMNATRPIKYYYIAVQLCPHYCATKIGAILARLRAPCNHLKQR